MVVVLQEEALLHGDLPACSPSSSPARASSALGRGVTKTQPTPTRRPPATTRLSVRYGAHREGGGGLRPCQSVFLYLCCNLSSSFYTFLVASLHTSSVFFFFPLALLLQLYRFSSTNYTARCSSACGAEPCRTNSSVSMQQCALECCNTPLCLQLNASSYGNCPRGSPGLGVRG